MNWTHERPTEEGWYWVLNPIRPDWVEIVELSDGLLLYGGDLWIPADYGPAPDNSEAFLWCGPIEQPPVPTELLAATEEKS